MGLRFLYIYRSLNLQIKSFSDQITLMFECAQFFINLLSVQCTPVFQIRVHKTERSEKINVLKCWKFSFWVLETSPPAICSSKPFIEAFIKKVEFFAAIKFFWIIGHQKTGSGTEFTKKPRHRSGFSGSGSNTQVHTVQCILRSGRHLVTLNIFSTRSRFHLQSRLVLDLIGYFSLFLPTCYTMLHNLHSHMDNKLITVQSFRQQI